MGGGNNESILIISLDTFKLDFFSLQNIRVQEKQFEVLRTILTFLVDYCGFFFMTYLHAFVLSGQKDIH